MPRRKPRQSSGDTGAPNNFNGLCGARLAKTPGRLARAARFGPAAVERYLRRSYCRQRPVPGARRCKYHGGLAPCAIKPKMPVNTVELLAFLAKLNAADDE